MRIILRQDRHKEKNKNNKLIKRIILGIVLFLFLLVGTGAGYYIASLSSFFNEISDSSGEINAQDYRLNDAEPFSVLLLGLDHASSGNQTDTIMVATVNPEQESINLVSIPRDTVVYSETGAVERINAMYAIGGVEHITDVVEDMLEIPISFYAIADFQALIDIVNAVGGITVNSDFSFTVQDSEENSGAIEIEEGVQDLNGEEALGYARMRDQDPRGDFGRQERQREVISAILDELVSLNTLTNFNNILTSVAPHVQTNITGRQSLMIAANYRDATNNVNSLSIGGAADTMYFPHYGFNVYVYRPSQESLEEVRQELQEHLDIEDVPQSSEEELLEEDGLGQDGTNNDQENTGPDYGGQEETYEVNPFEEEPNQETPEQTNPFGGEQFQDPPTQTNPNDGGQQQVPPAQTNPNNGEQQQTPPPQVNPNSGEQQTPPAQINPNQGGEF